MLSVLHIRSSFDPGGTETLLLNTFNHKQQHFKMYLVLLKDGSLIDHLDTDSGNQYFKWYRQKFIDLSVLRKMNRLIREQNIQILHTHQLIELLYAVLLKISNPSIRIIHQIHLLFERKNLAFLLERWISNMTSRVLTVSKTAKNLLTEEYNFRGDNIGVLYNGINEQNLPQKPDTRLTVDPTKFNIVMVANFVFGKDHETLLKAYEKHIRDKMPDASIYFIGRETGISQQLKPRYLNKNDLNEKRIVFCGSMPDAKKLLPRFDLVVMSCVSETFNIALAEAVFAEKQVLASDIPVFRELSEDGKFFHLFETGNHDDFFDQLCLLRQGENPKIVPEETKQFKEKFGFDAFLKNLANIYAELN